MLNINFTPFPILITERLRLRQINNVDENELFLLRSDERVMRFLDRPTAKSKEDILELIEKINHSLEANDGITWAISLKTGSSLIGTIGFWRIIKEHYRAEIGYMLLPAFHGKGFMQEAMTAVLNYGFQHMLLHSVEANVNPQNEDSIKILERHKFNREAWHKENFYYNGKFLDSFIYSLITPLK